ncbi:MAG: Uma2 family endonuclease [Planctomycetota bacterium]|jgi:Uma2 family endonuclease
MTAEQFAEEKFDLADGGRWAELIAGEPVVLEPPTSEHGTVVMNLTRALAAYVEQTRVGYACFELGVVVQRNPDTVLGPAISYFLTGNRWAETDNVVTESSPALVVEVPSTTDRRRSMQERIAAYQAHGVSLIWVVDLQQKHVAVHSRQEATVVLQSEHSLTSVPGWRDDSGSQLLTGFTLPLADIFAEPDWWTGG